MATRIRATQQPVAQAGRRLAAVVSADVAGYSRLVERDEEATVARIKQHFRSAVRPSVENHGGRMVKLMGDGALIEFPSVVEAVRASLEIQETVARMEAPRPEAERIRYRVGVHLGDVIIDGEDIHGHGVNVAARLQSLAEPGGICVSDAVRTALANSIAIAFKDLGPQEVKNIAERVRADRVLGAKAAPPRPARERAPSLLAAAAIILVLGGLGTGAYLGWPTGKVMAKVATSDILALPKGPTVGVVPFTATGTEPNAATFAEGMTDEITSDLTRFRELHVIARNTMSRYKDKPVDARDLARELGLDYVLEGTVRLFPGAVRITAELVDAKDARQIWSESYDRPMTPDAIIAVQDEVSSKITGAIGTASGGAIIAAAWKATLGRPPKELSSYECVVAAHAFFNSDQGYELARTCLREAVEREPEYAEAWALLARIYIEQWYGYAAPYPNETYDPLERAAQAARRAEQLSPDSPLAHFSMGKVHLMSGDLENFYAEAQQALRLNPNDPSYLCSLGSWIAYPGQWEEGLALIKKARELHHSTDCGLFAIAIDHYRKGEYQQALTVFNASFTGWWGNYMHRAYTYGMLGDKDNAARAVAKLKELVPGFTMDHAIAFHRKYQFEPAVLDKIVEGLRRAGVAEGQAADH